MKSSAESQLASVIPALPAAQANWLRPSASHIKVPRRQGELLITPTLSNLAASLAAGSPQDSPLSDGLREISLQARRDVLIAVEAFSAVIGSAPLDVSFAARSGTPWVVTGHQVEFYHAGVWAKVVAADELARRSRALAFDLLVDHDVLDEPGLYVPVRHNGELQKRLIEWAEPHLAGQGLPLEFVAAPTGQKRRQWLQRLRSACCLSSDSLDLVLWRLADNQFTDYVSWLSEARKRLETTLGIHVNYLRTSQLCSRAGWFGFVALWLQNAREWAKLYNAAVERYRQRYGITAPNQPLPPLHCSAEIVELPFWLYGQGQRRGRMMATLAGDTIKLLGASGEIPLPPFTRLSPLEAGNLLQQQCSQHGLHIRPRALTLTMFARLFVADVFIHGIGGALYDQISDDLLARLFGCGGSYGCVSAAWLLPLQPAADSGASPSQLRWQLHHLRHNPQLTLSAGRSEVAKLLQSRQSALAVLQAKPPQSPAGCTDAITRSARRQAFRQLHALLGELANYNTSAIQQLQTQLRLAELGQKEQAVAHWREYYFALHQRSSLAHLVNCIRHS
ncbi:MAG: hypothetical protein ACP5O7_05230 [Phycisphaerae bacterium]